VRLSSADGNLGRSVSVVDVLADVHPALITEVYFRADPDVPAAHVSRIGSSRRRKRCQGRQSPLGLQTVPALDERCPGHVLLLLVEYYPARHKHGNRERTPDQDELGYMHKRSL